MYSTAVSAGCDRQSKLGPALEVHAAQKVISSQLVMSTDEQAPYGPILGAACAAT